MDIRQILSQRPVIHSTAEGQKADMGIHPNVVNFLLDNVPQGGASLETGCGLSTVLFADRSATHTAITPVGKELASVLRFCRENGVRTDGLNLVEGMSEHVLPKLDTGPLDVVLIDGRHGFPAPFIDWFYTAGKLKTGGLLVVDDTCLWPPKVLRDLLAEQPQWELIRDFHLRCSVFRKVGEGSEWGDWTDQPFAYRNGYLRITPEGGVRLEMPRTPSLLERVAAMVARREWKQLARKALRRFGG